MPKPIMSITTVVQTTQNPAGIGVRARFSPDPTGGGPAGDGTSVNSAVPDQLLAGECAEREAVGREPGRDGGRGLVRRVLAEEMAVLG